MGLLPFLQSDHAEAFIPEPSRLHRVSSLIGSGKKNVNFMWDTDTDGFVTCAMAIASRPVPVGFETRNFFRGNLI